MTQRLPKVFCDNDGVLAHFDRHVKDLFGVWPREIPDDDMWALVEATPDFWPTIPLKHGAHELWAVIQPYRPVVLTGCPKSHYDVAAAHKVAWVKQHFGEEAEVITCLSRNKPLHMEEPGDILIDDFSSNIRRWVKAGGIGIHYRNFEQAMEDFNKVIDAL